MSAFSETAAAVEPVIMMLGASGCAYASATIFDDGSGTIVVRLREKDKVTVLLRAHGVHLDGYQDINDRDDYKFTIVIEALLNYKEVTCPHCGKEIASAL